LGLSKLLVGKLLEDSTYGMESSKRIPIGLLELYDHAVVLTLTVIHSPARKPNIIRCLFGTCR
ncbi:hypothetical protein, partial [Adlercreutzia sp. ZJ473]|uniref:hypothetical protein n=1 Tax=Adlercreutzia sp. ZJ473 TaxID=2722822 RepID=UPI001C12F791